MKKISILAIALSLSIIMTGTVFSKGRYHFKVVKIIIEQGYHHLGDNNIPSFLLPEPEGTYWETSFRLNKYVLKHKKISYVKFLGRNCNGSEIIINGNRITINDSGAEGPQNFSAYIIPIPFDYLIERNNIIEFESVYLTHADTYDDFEFGELQIWFQ